MPNTRSRCSIGWKGWADPPACNQLQQRWRRRLSRNGHVLERRIDHLSLSSRAGIWRQHSFQRHARSILRLDGQRLLLVSGSHRQVNAQYKTEIDGMSLVVITASENLTILGVNVPALVFTAYGKDGSIRQFGGANGTTTTRNDLNQFNAIAWQQTQLSDASGNAITYQYSSANQLGERYLQQINYTGGQVTFTYAGPSRTDASYSTYGPAQRSTLMRSISVRGPTGAMRYYTWTFGMNNALDGANPNYARYRITHIKECATESIGLLSRYNAGLEGSGSIRSKHVGKFQQRKHTIAQVGRLRWRRTYGSSSVLTNGVDGGNPQRLHVAYSRPSASGANFAAPITLPPAGLPDEYNDGAMWEVLDTNGDGRYYISYAHRDQSTQVLTWYRVLALDCNPACFGAEAPDHHAEPPSSTSSCCLHPDGDPEVQGVAIGLPEQDRTRSAVVNNRGVCQRRSQRLADPLFRVLRCHSVLAHFLRPV